MRPLPPRYLTTTLLGLVFLLLAALSVAGSPMAGLFVTTPDGETLSTSDPAATGLNQGDQGHTFILRNTGTETLTALSLIRNAGSILAESSPLIASLEPGAEVAFDVSSNDLIDREQSQSVFYRIEALAPPPFQLNFSVDYGFYPNSESLFKWMTPTRLLLTGESATFTTQTGIGYSIREHAWLRNNKKISNDAQLTITALKLTDAGTYHQKVKHVFIGGIGSPGSGLRSANSPALSAQTMSPRAHIKTIGEGTSTSQPILLGVVQPAPAAAQVPEGKPLILTCTAAGPRGHTLGYQWYRNGSEVEDGDGIQGSRTAKLQIPADHALITGTFDCIATLEGDDRIVTLSHGETIVTLIGPPDIAEVADGELTRFVGGTVTLQLTATEPADRFTAKKLPPGLTINATGLISGHPTKAGTYDSTVIATNPAGTGTPRTLTWIISSPLQPGAYEGLIDREGDLDDGQGLGSQVKITTTTTGTLSGQLTHGGKAWRFTSKTVKVEAEAEALPTAEILISRGRSLPALTLILDTDDGTLALTDGTATATGLLRRAAFDKATPATAYAGYYTAALERQVSLDNQAHPDIPAGLGYFTGTLSPTGVLTWRGKLADGTAITGSAPLTAWEGEEQLHLPIHLPLYQGTGSLHGWANIPEPTNRQIYGPLSWNKAPLGPNQKSRNYENGIPLHTVYLSAVPYTPPEKGSLLFGVEDESDNLGLIFFGPGIVPGSPIRNVISLRAGNKIYPPELSPTTPLKSLTLNVAKGTFKGTVTFLDESDPKLNRTVATEGVMLSELGGAIGFFLLPELPDEATTLKTSALRSCSIDFHPR